MTPLATLAYASCGIYAFVALHYGTLWWMRRQSAEHGAVALLAAMLGLFALSAAAVADATDVAAAASAQEVQCFFGALSAAAYASFCVRMTGAPAPRLERTVWAVAAVAAGACAAGFFVDPAVPAPDWDGRAPALGGRPGAALLPAGVGALAACIGVATVALARLGRAAVRDRSLRPTFAAAALPVAGGIWDLAVRVTGAPLPLISSVIPVVAVTGISWALLDRFVRIDAELAQRTQQLTESYEALQHAQKELIYKEQLAALGELSAVIAHEVRNPLAIIRNAVAGLRRAQIAPRDAETLLGIVDDETDRLNRLVQDLLTYARPVHPEPVPVVVTELVEGAVALALQGQSHHKNIEVTLRADSSVDVVEGDPALLRHALINIVDNAIQAMPDGGTVSIACRATVLDGREAVAIDFHDEGEGMDTLVRRKARDLFFTTRATGTGLGLAIVDRVARVHGGRVEIDSRQGQGTTVTLVLPRRRWTAPPPPPPPFA